MKNHKQTPQGTPHSKTSTRSKGYWPIARVAEVKTSCPRVGDDGKVAYPPFLMAYDSEREGERAVKGRLTQPDSKREVKK